MPSTDAQHRYQRSSIHHIKAQPITCRSRDPDASTLSFPSHYASFSIAPLQPIHISFPSISLTHRTTIPTGLFTIDRPLLLSTSRFILPISFESHCLIPRPTFRYLSLSSPIFSYTASLSITPPYALSFLFLSFSFPSHSYWLYHYIFILAITHPLIHPSSHWLAIVLLPFPRSSECSSRSYWSIARPSLLYESDSIATPSCIYTYHE